jgi:hypothetical protein
LTENLKTRYFGIALAAIALLVALGGCNGAGDAETVTLTGRVTLDGKPVDGASVAFVGREGARLSTAQTNAMGDFTITAALGKNAVSIAKMAVGGAAPAPVSEEDMLMPSDEEYQRMQRTKPAPAGIPAKYADPKTSGINIDVVSGMQDVELALSSS